MDYVHLGRSGLSVSRLCLGTMNFGPHTADADAHAIMDRAHELGINFFDTANVVRLGPRTKGADRGDHRRTGSRGGGGRRERTVLATKLYGDMGDWPNEGKLSALNIRRACDASLRRLQTDYIDLYQMHHVDRARRGTRSGRRWRSSSRRARSSTSARQLRRLAHRPGAGGGGAPALPRPGQRAVHLQPGDPRGRARGAARRRALRGGRHPVVAAARRPARRRAAQGTGRRRRWRAGPPRRSRRTATQIEPYEDLCAELGQEPAEVALAWLLHPPAVTAPIVGPRTAAQLDAGVARGRRQLDDEGAGPARRDLPRLPHRAGALRLVRLLGTAKAGLDRSLAAAGPVPPAAGHEHRAVLRPRVRVRRHPAVALPARSR